MTKLIKFLKPFIFSIIILIILVFIQTMSDLKLPDLMSEIVNNGLTKVEYSVDKEVLQEVLQKGEFPEFQKFIAEIAIKQGVTNPEEIDFDIIGNQMKEGFLNEGQSTDIDPEVFSIVQKMMELNIIKTTPNPDKVLIWKTGGIMLLVALLSGICTIFVSFLASKISIGAGANIRKAIFVHIEKFSRFEINKFGTSSLITRTTNDIIQIQTTLFMIFRMVLGAPITFIGGVIMATRKSTSLAMNLVYVIPILIVVIFIVAKKSLKLFRTQQERLDKLNNIARENITGVRAIRAYNRIEHEEKRFDEANKKLVETSLKVNKIMAVLMPIIMMIMNVTVASVIWVGAKQIDLGHIQAGDIIAFIQYAFQILFAFMMFAIVFVLLPRASASAERINEVLKTEPSIKEPEQTKETKGQGYLEFKNVTFTYPGAESPAVKNISFKMEPRKNYSSNRWNRFWKIYINTSYNAFL